MTTYTYLGSPLGQLQLTSREGKLTGLAFADQNQAPRVGQDWIEREDADIFIQTRRQLEEYASGERERFDLPFGLSGTAFHVSVWTAIAAIPFGQTITYGELARRVGRPPGDARAVGSATGSNPVCWIVPCHRVVGKSGALTGYAGGVARKSALLEFEAARSAGRDAILAYGQEQPAPAFAQI